MQRSGVASSLESLSTVCALVATLMLLPWFTNASGDWALNMFEGLYGTGYRDIFTWGWILVCTGTLFYGVRALLSISLAAISGWIVFRF